MRIGTLVKNIEYDYIGVIDDYIESSSLIGGYIWRVRWINFDVYDYYSTCELEVLCE